MTKIKKARNPNDDRSDVKNSNNYQFHFDKKIQQSNY